MKFERQANMSGDEELEKIKERMLREMMNPAKESILADGSVTALDASNFDEAIANSPKPVLVDFWAGWCMPCKVMKPVFEAMARDYAGRAYFAKVDIDRNPSVAMKFDVMSIPNFVVFKDGRPVDRVVGAVGRPGLEGTLRKHLTPG